MSDLLTYKQLIDLSQDCVKRLDLEGRIIDVNRAGVALLRVDGEHVLLGQDWVAMWPAAYQAAVAHALEEARQGRKSSFVGASGDPDVEQRWWTVHVGPLVDEQGTVVALGSVSREVTERVHVERSLDALNDALRARLAATQRSLVQVQERLDVAALAEAAAEHMADQAQKGEAIGHLVAGMGHDFNNHLQTVLSALDALDALGELNATQTRYAGFAMDAARHAAVMSRQMLAFSRMHPYTPDHVDLGEVVADIVPMLQGAVGRGMQIAFAAAEKALPVFADGHSVQQALLNLSINAKDACQQQGTIQIAFTDFHVGADGATLNLPEGDYVAIEVKDTGDGMSEEVQERLFQPFFTTKASGKGTGLGMAQVLGLMRQASGSVQVVSAPGAGTTVRLIFPCAGELTVA
ncbi:PAS domain-containing protein [Bacillus sp. NP157]|nr:PAS domain-containing protein [Bacillus sp. NP157]